MFRAALHLSWTTRTIVAHPDDAHAREEIPWQARDVLLESAPSPLHVEGSRAEPPITQKPGRAVRATSDSRLRPAFWCCRCRAGCEKDLRCKRCRLIRYCSKECQVADWPRHRSQCLTEDEIASLLDSECRAVVESPVFSQLARCLKEYNEELRSRQSAASAAQARDVPGRRVGGLVTIQKLESLPIALQGRGTHPFTVTFADLKKEDRDARGEPLWSFTLVPSLGGVSAKIEDLEYLPELDREAYERWRDDDLFDGHGAVSCLGEGELVGLENATLDELRAAGMEVMERPDEGEKRSSTRPPVAGTS